MSTPLETLTLALWNTHVYYPLSNFSAWLDVVERQLQQAQQAGAKLLILPEYMAEQWLNFAPAGLAEAEEIPWLAKQAPTALEGLASLVNRYKVGLLAGTMPVSLEHVPALTTPPYVNRAHLFLPDGRVLTQDKLCLTPTERQPEAWYLSAGNQLNIFEWHGLRIAMLICLDVELPVLSARLAAHNVDLVLVPSMTHTHAGHARVFGCARARAIELCCAVAVVGCVGEAAPPREQERPNISAAAVFVPSEIQQGVFYETPVATQANGAGQLHIVSHIPMAQIRNIRQGGKAEVWPGHWQGEHVRIVEHSSR